MIKSSAGVGEGVGGGEGEGAGAVEDKGGGVAAITLSAVVAPSKSGADCAKSHFGALSRR